LTTLLLCAGLLFFFWSCQTPAGRTVGQVVDDSTITTKVKAKIFQDSILKGFAISVKTFEGEVPPCRRSRCPHGGEGGGQGRGGNLINRDQKREEQL
jgi:hypothetical protein